MGRKGQIMALYHVSWRTEGGAIYHGFVRAYNMEYAYDVAKANLNKSCYILSISDAYESMITPQSLTINFRNDTDYHSF